ncbi:MAG: hypothetical protein ACE5OZ_01110 [Candidatus Heimdallarchaeota archaeon]
MTPSTIPIQPYSPEDFLVDQLELLLLEDVETIIESEASDGTPRATFRFDRRGNPRSSTEGEMLRDQALGIIRPFARALVKILIRQEPNLFDLDLDEFRAGSKYKDALRNVKERVSRIL